MMRILNRLALAAVMAAAPAAAHAGCALSHIAGTWEAYWISAANAGASTVRCKMSISAAGVIAGSSTCTDYLGETLAVTGGTFTLAGSATCTYIGQFKLATRQYKIVHSTMSLDKNLVNGMGTFPGGTYVFSLTKL